jgi:radical SAM protein with 4Fe4S-binding SPASM domain
MLRRLATRIDDAGTRAAAADVSDKGAIPRVAAPSEAAQVQPPGAQGHTGTSISPTAALHNLSWIDDFWAQAGEHIFSREDDGVLILPPNRVYRVNATGSRLIAYLRRGGSMRRLRLPSEEAARDTTLFFGDLVALYRGETPMNGTVSAEQYSFSFTRLPVLGEIALTYRCNNACRFCYAGCGSECTPTSVAETPRAQGAPASCPAAVAPSLTVSPQSARPERSTADYRRIIDVFANEAKIPFFSFTGGEPTLRDDLEALIAHARIRGLITNLVTNGTLIDDARARSLKDAGLGSVQVSIEAPDAETHDFLTGRPMAFAETLAGIAALQRAGIPTQTNTTITRGNLHAIRRMPEFLTSLGIRRFAMNLFIPTIEGPEADRLFVSYEEIGPHVDEVSKAARALGMTFFWYSPTPFCTYNPIARGFGNKSCAAADGLLSVAPDGSVLPCSSWDEPIGNLFEQPFREVWFSARARFYKEKRFAPPSCRACDKFVACQGACPLYWRYTHTEQIGRASCRERV